MTGVGKFGSRKPNHADSGDWDPPSYPPGAFTDRYSGSRYSRGMNQTVALGK